MPPISTLVPAAGRGRLVAHFIHHQALGVLRWCLGSLLGLVATQAAQAQTTEAYNWNSVAIGGGGFVSGLVMSKSQSGLMYARTDVGGAYRWDANAATWVPLLDFASDTQQGLFGVESLALDPQKSGMLYMLCGISYFNNGTTYILRSTDYGATFTIIDVSAQFKAHGNGDGRGNGEKLQVDPLSSSTLYCGTRYNGLFKSTNSGSSWSRLSGLNVTTTPSTNGVSFVVLDKSSNSGGVTKRLFAGISRSGGNQNLYKSEDAGATFTVLNNPNLGSTMIPQRAVLASGNLVVTYGDGVGPQSNGSGSYTSGQVWKYNVAGGTWTNLTPAGVNHAFSGISIDPGNASRMVLSTCNYYGLQYTTSQGTGVYGDRYYLSTNGGSSWTDVVARGFTFDPNGVTWITGQSMHWGACIEFDPFSTSKVLVVSGNGIFQNDNINTSGTWKFQVKGLEETVAQNVVSLPGGGPLISTILDYDGFRHTDVTKYAAVHQPRMGSTSGLDYAGQDPDKLVRVGSDMYISTDQGVSWAKTSTTKGTSGQVALSASGSTLLHCPGSSTTTYRTTNDGDSWTTVTGLSITSARPVADRVNSNKFYAYDPNSGTLSISTDNGVSFKAAGNPGTGGSKVIRTIPGREGHLWVALYSGGLARSTNSGATFTKITNVTRCDAVGYGLAASGASYQTIFIYGTVNGVLGIHRSTDEGASWVRVNDDRHEFGGPANGQFVMGDINIYGRVYMSTAGRGIAVGRVASSTTPANRTALASAPAAPDQVATLQVYPNPAGAAITVALPAELVGGTLTVFNSLGAAVRTERVLQPSQALDLSQLPAGLYSLRVANGQQGSTVRLVKD